LFEGLNPSAENIIINAASKRLQRKSSSLKTKLSLKNLSWTKSIPQNIIEDDSFASDEDIEPGPCPLYLFMPSKVQVMMMVLKAAYDERNIVHLPPPE
jgi:hypothetical protein